MSTAALPAGLPGAVTPATTRKPQRQPAPGGTPSGKNTLGLVVPATAAVGAAAAVKLTQISAPAPEEQEKSWLESGMDYAKQVATDNKGMLNSVADAIGQFGDSAGQVGGDVALASAGTAGAGGLVALTGVGAPVGGAMVAVGAAGGVVGGVVAGVGGLANVAATGMRSAVTALTGGTVNATAVAAGLAEKIVVDKVTRVVDATVGRVINKASSKGDSKPAADKPTAGSATGGGGDKGSLGGRALRDRCALRTYKNSKCPKGETPHHVVPDHSFKQPGRGGTRYGSAPSHDNGLCICVGGATKSTMQSGERFSFKRFAADAVKQAKDTGLATAAALKENYYQNLAEHGRIHLRLDAQEQMAGLLGTPKGTIELGKMEAMSAKAVADETGCDAKELEKQLREHHKQSGLDDKALVRADPYGRMNELVPELMGRPARGGGG